MTNCDECCKEIDEDEVTNCDDCGLDGICEDCMGGHICESEDDDE